MFDVKTYSEEFTIRNLVEVCKIQDTSFVVDDPYKLKVDVTALNQRLQQLDKRTIHQRRQLLNRLFWVQYPRENKLFPYCGLEQYTNIAQFLLISRKVWLRRHQKAYLSTTCFSCLLNISLLYQRTPYCKRHFLLYLNRAC
jgi:hypothetical protein